MNDRRAAGGHHGERTPAAIKEKKTAAYTPERSGVVKVDASQASVTSKRGSETQVSNRLQRGTRNLKQAKY